LPEWNLIFKLFIFVLFIVSGKVNKSNVPSISLFEIVNCNISIIKYLILILKSTV
jgi:hypothetical protein